VAGDSEVPLSVSVKLTAAGTASAAFLAALLSIQSLPQRTISRAGDPVKRSFMSATELPWTISK
jgi:hypothetical protein